MVLAADQFCERSQCMQWPQANNFFGAFSIFESGGITKHLMTGPSGKSEFCFASSSMFPSASPRGTLRVSGKQNSLFPLWLVIKCLLFHTSSEIWNAMAWDRLLQNSSLIHLKIAVIKIQTGTNKTVVFEISVLKLAEASVFLCGFW